MTCVVVCGAREWTDRTLIRQGLRHVPHGATVIVGGAPGADTLAEEEARRMGYAIKRMPANWEVTEDTPSWAIAVTASGRRYDKRAGPLRNRAMLDERPDYVLAFAEELEGGTGDCVGEARHRGITVEWVSSRTVTVYAGHPTLF